MSTRHGWVFEPTFNRSIKIPQADPRITSDAGTLLLREVDQRLGLTADLAARTASDTSRSSSSASTSTACPSDTPTRATPTPWPTIQP